MEFRWDADGILEKERKHESILETIGVISEDLSSSVLHAGHSEEELRYAVFGQSSSRNLVVPDFESGRASERDRTHK